MLRRFFARRLSADKALFTKRHTPARKRKLAIEGLERRAMLDGAGVATVGSTLNDGLIASYTFEGSLNDTAGSGNDLLGNGTFGYVTEGRTGGQALRTLGDRSVNYSSGGFLRAGYLENANLDAVTFNFWTRNEQSGSTVDDLHAWENYVQVGYGTTDDVFGLGVQPITETGSPAVERGNLQALPLSDATATWADWKMWTVTLESPGTDTDWAVYLDGQEIGSGSYAADLFPSVNVVFGAHTWAGGASG